MSDAPIVLDIGIDGVKGDGDGILGLRLAEFVRIAQQEVRKSDPVVAAASRRAPVEVVRSGGVGENLLVLMRVQPGEAEFEVMRTPGPGEIVLVLVAAPGVRPWPVPIVHAYTDLASAEIDPGDLVDGVGGRKERRSSKTRRGVPLVGVGDEDVVAILVVRRFVEQAGADVVSGVDDCGPGRNDFERSDGGISVAGPGSGGRSLAERVMDEMAE